MHAKKEGFSQRSRGDFRKSNFLGLGGVLETFFGSTTLQEVAILPTLVYFHPKRLILGEMLYRCPKALSGWFMNRLKPFLWFICGCGLPKM